MGIVSNELNMVLALFITFFSRMVHISYLWYTFTYYMILIDVLYLKRVSTFLNWFNERDFDLPLQATKNNLWLLPILHLLSWSWLVRWFAYESHDWLEQLEYSSLWNNLFLRIRCYIIIIFSSYKNKKLSILFYNDLYYLQSYWNHSSYST